MIDQLLVKNLTATVFDAEAASRPLPVRARTVVVGGGIVGASDPGVNFSAIAAPASRALREVLR